MTDNELNKSVDIIYNEMQKFDSDVASSFGVVSRDGFYYNIFMGGMSDEIATSIAYGIASLCHNIGEGNEFVDLIADTAKEIILKDTAETAQ